MKIKQLYACCLAGLTLTTTFPASAASNPDAAFFDAVLGRPVGLAATAVGGAVFVISLPFTAASGSIKSSADSLVGKPGRFTFTRPLGDFSYPHHRHHERQVAGKEPAPQAPKQAKTVDRSKSL
jgi:hypothetical protein